MQIPDVKDSKGKNIELGMRVHHYNQEYKQSYGVEYTGIVVWDKRDNALKVEDEVTHFKGSLISDFSYITEIL